MIYLIGGSPRCGKTTIAKKLSQRLKIGWISVDTLESIVREYISNPEDEKLFPKNALRHVTSNSNDEMYSRFSYQKIANSYIKQGKTSWKAVSTFVEDSIKEGHDFIVEGHQIHPKLAYSLLKQYPKEIKVYFLAKQDIQALVEGFTKNNAKNDWVIQKTKNPETFYQIAKMLCHFGKYILMEASKYKLPVYLMDKDFKEKINSIVKSV